MSAKVIGCSLLAFSFTAGLHTGRAQDGPRATEDVPRTVWGDYDGDGLLDAYVVHPRGEDRLFRNRGDGGFEDATDREGLAGRTGTRAAAWGDGDADGDLDLVVLDAEGSLRLYHRREGGPFLEEPLGAELAGVRDSVDVEWVDYDRDGLADLLLARESRAPLLFHALPAGRFEGIELPIGAAPPGGPAGGPGGAEGLVGAATGTGPERAARAPTSGRVPPAARPDPGGTGGAGSHALLPNHDPEPVVGFCATTIRDAAVPSNCVEASSLPTLGSLYPLGPELNIDPAGKVGIGTLAPLEALDVAGAVRIGDTTQLNTGTLRWTGADFEGYDGSSWRSLTSGGGGGAGGWNDDGTVVRLTTVTDDVGVGTVAPQARLHVDATASPGGVALRADTTGTGLALLGVGTVQGSTGSRENDTPGVKGESTGPVGRTYGVHGTASSVSDDAAGVLGEALAAGGAVHGVRGVSSSSGDGTAGVRAEALAAGGRTYGVDAVTSSADPGASGVRGQALAGTGQTTGVEGETLSATAGAAGVSGTAGENGGNVCGVVGHTLSDADGSIGVYGLASDPAGVTTGVRGVSASATDAATGVRGDAQGTTGRIYGVHGTTASTSDGTVGVRGEALGATGVTEGVRGSTSSTTDEARGVHGKANAATGRLYGVLGETGSGDEDGAGVKGLAGPGSGPGVLGVTNANSEPAVGVKGISTHASALGFGVWGITNTTDLADAAGVYGEAKGAMGRKFGVRGRNESTTLDSAGVKGRTSGGQTYGVHGVSSSAAAQSAGVKGESFDGQTYGVHGVTVSAGGFAAGVRGESSVGLTYGVLGITTSDAPGAAGVYGQGSDPATYGVEGVTLSPAPDAAGVRAVGAGCGAGAALEVEDGAIRVLGPDAESPVGSYTDVAIWTSIESSDNCFVDPPHFHHVGGIADIVVPSCLVEPDSVILVTVEGLPPCPGGPPPCPFRKSLSIQILDRSPGVSFTARVTVHGKGFADCGDEYGPSPVTIHYMIVDRSP